MACGLSTFTSSKPAVRKATLNKLQLHYDPFVPEDFQTTPLVLYHSKLPSSAKHTAGSRKTGLMNEKGDASKYLAFQKGLIQCSELRYTSTPACCQSWDKVISQDGLNSEVSPVVDVRANGENMDSEFHFQPHLITGQTPKERARFVQNYSANSYDAVKGSMDFSQELSRERMEVPFIATKLVSDEFEKAQIVAGREYISSTSDSRKSLYYDGDYSGVRSFAESVSTDTEEIPEWECLSTVPRYTVQPQQSSLSRYRKGFSFQDHMGAEITSKVPNTALKRPAKSCEPELRLTKPALKHLEDDFEYKPSKKRKHSEGIMAGCFTANDTTRVRGKPVETHSGGSV